MSPTTAAWGCPSSSGFLLPDEPPPNRLAFQVTGADPANEVYILNVSEGVVTLSHKVNALDFSPIVDTVVETNALSVTELRDTLESTPNWSIGPVQPDVGSEPADDLLTTNDSGPAATPFSLELPPAA